MPVIVVLLSAVLFLPSCMPSPPTIALIIKHRALIVSALQFAAGVSDRAGQEMESSYASLSALSRTSQGLEATHIQQMEYIHRRVSAKSDSLSRAVAAAHENAQTYFQMMHERAEENQTEALQKQMMRQIEEKCRSFEGVLSRAETGSEKLNVAIQRYDDIVGYLQVQEGLSQIDQIEKQVGAITSEATAMRVEMRDAVQEGLALLENFEMRDDFGSRSFRTRPPVVKAVGDAHTSVPVRTVLEESCSLL